MKRDEGAASNAERPGHHGRTRIDADALVDHLDSLRRSVTAGARGHTIEIYHRAALTLSVTLDGRTGAIATKRGDDQGLALRMATVDGKEVGFSSASGSGLSSLEWLIARCHERPGPPEEATWARGRSGVHRDLDGDSELPPVESLVSWVERAREVLLSDGPGGPTPLEVSIEAVVTVETWLADGGLRASRARGRGWAFLRTSEPSARDRASKPVLLARRRFQDLPVEGLREVLEDRRLPDRTGTAPPARPVPVLFNPECSAHLSLSLVKALHGPTGPARLSVGAAWKLWDAPGEREASSGGAFDDAGFPTRRLELADGRTSTGRIEGRGHLRRGSYRDRPVALPSHLVLSAGGDGAPDRGVVVTSLDVHAVEPRRWLLRVEGAHLDGGRPVALLSPSYVSIAPDDLVRRCVAAVGPPRLSHLGVETPALLFDDLRLEPSTRASS